MRQAAHLRDVRLQNPSTTPWADDIVVIRAQEPPGFFGVATHNHEFTDVDENALAAALSRSYSVYCMAEGKDYQGVACYRDPDSGKNVMTDLSEILSQRRDDFLQQLGSVDDRVVSRLVPGGSPWPSSALGKLRVVECKKTRLLVTDGLSDLYDPELHPEPPRAPLDFELCLEVLNRDPCATSNESLGASWYAKVLFHLGDFMVQNWFDLRGNLGKYSAISAPVVVPEEAASSLGYDDGTIGVLVGLPLRGRNLDRHPYLSNYYRGSGADLESVALGFFPVKPLVKREYQFALDHGNEGAANLAQRFLDRGDGHVHFAGRPAVVGATGGV